MGWQIDDALVTPANRAVLRYLVDKAPSAHSDLADELRLASQNVPGACLYCPDTARYAFFAVHSPDFTIIALALGMKQLVFRLPATLVDDALQDCGTLFPEIGSEWVCFIPYSKDEPLVETRARLARWCREAGTT